MFDSYTPQQCQQQAPPTPVAMQGACASRQLHMAFCQYLDTAVSICCGTDCNEQLAVWLEHHMEAGSQSHMSVVHMGAFLTALAGHWVCLLFFTAG